MIQENFLLDVTLIQHPPNNFIVRVDKLDFEYVKQLKESYLIMGSLSTTIFKKNIFIWVKIKGKKICYKIYNKNKKGKF